MLRGKLEFEPGEEGREIELLEHLLRRAVADTARERFAGLDLRPLADAVADGHLVTHRRAGAGQATCSPRCPSCRCCTTSPHGPAWSRTEPPGRIAAAVELALEALYLSEALAKDADDDTTVYGD